MKNLCKFLEIHKIQARVSGSSQMNGEDEWIHTGIQQRDDVYYKDEFQELRGGAWNGIGKDLQRI